MIDSLTKRSLVRFFLLLCFCCAPVVHAEINIKLTGSCEQFNSVIKKGTLEEAIIFMSYRASANGQVTAYNHALFSAGYKIPLVDRSLENPEIYLLKKMVTTCKQVEPHLNQYPYLVAENIAVLIKERYKKQNQWVNFNFKTLLDNSEKKAFLTTQGLNIGLGNEACKVVSKNTKEKLSDRFLYKVWAAGYFVPYILMKDLEQEQGLDMLEAVYEQSLEYCSKVPNVVYARAVLAAVAEVVKR